MIQATTDTSAWLHEICRRFSNLVGWPVKFAPADSPRAAELERWLLAPSEYCWAIEVHNGTQRTGYLYIDLPQNSTADRSFLTVCGLTEIFAELLSTVAETSRSLESQTRDLTALVDISRPATGPTSLAAVLERLLRGALQLTGFRAAGLFLLQPGGDKLALRVYHTIDALQVPFATRDVQDSPPDLDALARGSVLLHRDLSPKVAQWLPESCATAVALAVRAEAGPLGTLWAFDRRRRMPTNRDFHVLESIAAQVASVLERAVLLQESADQHRLQRHLQQASEGETREIGKFPDDAGIDAAAVCASRYELGGDLCEIVPLDRGRVLISVGDAAGDSVPAAMVMSAARGALRTLAASDPSITAERAIGRLNQMLYSVTAPHQFMSMVCGILEIDGRRFVYSNAGHPNPVLFRQGLATPLESHGMLLGVTDDATYQQSSLPLESGDVLVLFSDGITEAMNSRHKMFRSDGIVEAVRGAAHRSAREILEAIWSRLETHSRNGSEADDRTLLVLKVR